MQGRLGIVLGTLLLGGCGSSDPRTWEKCTDARCADPAANESAAAELGQERTSNTDVHAALDSLYKDICI